MPIASTTGHGSAPGKVILLGEHAVVYGRTAVAVALDRHVRVNIVSAVSCDEAKTAPRRDCGEGSTWESAPFPVTLFAPIESEPSPELQRLRKALACAAGYLRLDPSPLALSVDTDLPMAVGLGSSAALSVALVRALAAVAAFELDDTSVCNAALEVEKLFHGYPSGIDNTVATFGGMLAFKRGQPHRQLNAACALPLVVAVGRLPRQTQAGVLNLRGRWQREPDRYEGWFDEIDWLAGTAEGAIANGHLGKLGGLMNSNHRLLQQLGVSTPELDSMVDLARAHGALGAKLTGGGGGGAVICLCPDSRDELIRAFAAAGWNAFTTDLHPALRGEHAGNLPAPSRDYRDLRA
ncbi:MAG: mevalonate kinase [Deltaproteobacteria bacterium]|nr:mevalonate kinase [Deltaproteobacteria bacterium]